MERRHFGKTTIMGVPMHACFGMLRRFKKVFSTRSPTIIQRWNSQTSNSTLDLNKCVFSVRVNVCCHLYQQWHQANVHRGKPVRGLDLDVVYLDTNPKALPSTPVILALHGTATTHHYFANVIPFLTRTGARVIIPNYPGCGLTIDKTGKFSNSDQERASFVLDFLDALDISKIGVLLSHSSSIYPSMYLMRGSDVFQSLALITPTGHRVPSKFKYPAWLYQLLLILMEKRGLGFLKYALRPLYPSTGGILNPDKLELFARNLFLVNYDYVVESLKIFRLQNLPFLLLYSTVDDFVEQQIFKEMTEILDFQPDDITRYSKTKQLTQPGLSISDKTPYKCVVIEEGNHFPMKTHSKIVGDAILELLHYVNSISILSSIPVSRSKGN